MKMQERPNQARWINFCMTPLRRQPSGKSERSLENSAGNKGRGGAQNTRKAMSQKKWQKKDGKGKHSGKGRKNRSKTIQSKEKSQELIRC